MRILFSIATFMLGLAQHNSAKFLSPNPARGANYSAPWIRRVYSNAFASELNYDSINSGERSRSGGTRFMLKLYDHLFEHYRNEIRPVSNDSQPIAVIVKFWLKQILKVDERDQTLNVYCWLEMYWIDEFLKWDPKDFGGVDLIHVPSSKIWRPDILVYNNANMNVEDSELETNAIIKHTGEVTLFRAMITDITCTLSLLLFPFDQQVCYLTFASWSMDGSKLLISPLNISTSLELYVRNSEWELIDFAAKMYEKIYDCCPHPFPDLTFFIALKRSPSYYIFSLIVPSAFITVVTIVGFFTPHSTTGENHEKVSTAVTALLSMTIIMMMISDEVPATSEVMPLIGKYYIGLIFIIFIAAFTTTITLALQMRGNAGARMSPSMRRFLFERVAKSLFISWLFTVQITDQKSARKFHVRRRDGGDGGGDLKQKLSGNGNLRNDCFTNTMADIGARSNCNTAGDNKTDGRRRETTCRPDFIDLKGKLSRRQRLKFSASSTSPIAPLHSPLINFQKAVGGDATVGNSYESHLYCSADLNQNNNVRHYGNSYNRFDVSTNSCNQHPSRDIYARDATIQGNDNITSAFPQQNNSMDYHKTTNCCTTTGKVILVQRICDCVETIEDYITEIHEQRFIEFEWEQGTRIIERLIMIFYIILTMAFAFFMLGNTGDDVVLTDELMDRVKR